VNTDFLQLFDIDSRGGELVCLVGGGGKTTAMFALAGLLKRQGAKVLVTTTTNIFYPGEDRCGTVILDSSRDPALFSGIRPGTVTCLGAGLIQDKLKLKSVDPDFIDRLFRDAVFSHILVEADGAKRKPIKAPAAYEPVIPSRATRVIGVVGVDAIGTPLDDRHVHRPELFSQLTGRPPGAAITADDVACLVNEPAGLFKNAPPACRRYLLLNKADDPEQINLARDVAAALRRLEAVPDGTVIAAVARGTAQRQ